MNTREIIEKLAAVDDMDDRALHQVQCQLAGMFADLENDGLSDAAAAARLTSLSEASRILDRVFAARGQAALSASGEPPAKRDARSKVARMAARQTPPRPSPELYPEGGRPRTALIATGGMRDLVPGTELDKHSLAQGMAATLEARKSNAPQGPRGSHGKDVVIVASASWADQYPEERRMTGDQAADEAKWRALTEPDALVATGGICSPVNVDWSIGMIATPDRPIQAGLPATLVSRGGLIYRPDLDFAALEAGVTVWTESTDASPAGATKPIFAVACPSTETVYVDAIPVRLGFGNMQSRFDPETVAANTNASLAAAARVAENNLLNHIATSCTQGVTTGKVLGSTRDLLMAIGQVVAAFRNLHRIPRSQQLRAIFPDWCKELIRIDLARETAHSQNDQWNSLMISDQQIDDIFETWGVSPIWHLDGQSTSAPGLSGAVDQFFTAQTANAAIQSFPTEMVWYLFYEGCFQYLDGGRLDLGIVRDSLLDATNDYEVFVEQLESVAFRGFTGGAIQLVSTLCANGGSAATISTTSSCA